MPIFTNKAGKLTRVDEISFALEKDMQKLTEENLHQIFSLQLVKSEFALNDLRIDTLAFDPENKAFVVIEYKNDQNFSVIDQGYAYLALLLNNKAEFILCYNENCGANLKKEDIDWSQSRVMFITPTFTKYQQQAINFRDLPIELWEIKKFANEIILYSQLKSPESSESIKTVSKSKVVAKVSEEVKVYSEEDHLQYASAMRELYSDFKSQVLNLGNDIQIVPKKEYIAFKRKTNFVDVDMQKTQIKIHINLRKGQLDDPKNIARDVSSIGHYGNGDYEIMFSKKDDITYLMTLIKQAYDKNFVVRGSG